MNRKLFAELGLIRACAIQYEKNMKPYLLLTPGPLTTTESVKQAMMSDWCTWDADGMPITTRASSK